jgi:hypothetical protein
MPLLWIDLAGQCIGFQRLKAWKAWKAWKGVRRKSFFDEVHLRTEVQHQETSMKLSMAH